MQAIDAARKSLVEQLEPIDAEAVELETRLGQLNEDRSRLKAAIKALDATKKPKGKSAARAGRPSPKQKDVRDVATTIVTENPGLLKSALEDLTKDRLTNELGFDLKGFEMRWNEVLGSGEFKLFTIGDEECVKLAGQQTEADAGDRKEKGGA